MKRGIALAALVCLAAAGGCMSHAKVVYENKADGTGTVSIPGNTDYYKREARDLIDKQVNGQKVTITYDGPAKPGVTPSGAAAPPSAPEWWVSYRVQGTATNGPTQPNGVNPAGGMVMPNGAYPNGGMMPNGVSPAGGMMPQQPPLPAGMVPNPFPNNGMAR